MFFWNSLAFSMIQQMLAIWSLVPLPFLYPAWTSRSSWFTYCGNVASRILSITMLACEMSAIAQVVWTFFGIAFLRDWNENWPFPVLCPLLRFPNLLAYWVPLCFSFFGDGLDHCPLYNVMNLHISSGILSIRSNPLNLFITSTV